MKKLMLYIHIPFCDKKCYYCDFVSFKSDYLTINDYIKVLLSEIEAKSYLANDYEISSIYIGGGTPSSIDSKYIRYILESIYQYYTISKICEISIELNPHSVITEKLYDYYDIGINRLSFGLQSSNNDELKILGRIHTFDDFLKSYNDALHIGFKNINVDMINGIPLQTATTYRNSLKNVLMLHINHISIYNLIIEPGTVFYNLWEKGELNTPHEDELLKIDNVTKELTSYYKLNRYEISNYAKVGYECKHNLGYWEGIEYLGFGLNSSSLYNNKRLKNIKNISKYLNLKYKYYITEPNKNIYYEEIQNLTEKDMINEFIMLGFRKIKGINTKDFNTKFNKTFEDIFSKKLEKYVNNNFITKENDTYRLTDVGLDVSNSILSDLLI